MAWNSLPKHHSFLEKLREVVTSVGHVANYRMEIAFLVVTGERQGLCCWDSDWSRVWSSQLEKHL